VITVATERELRHAVKKWRAEGERIGLVPTMGALHAGHLALVELARKHASRVVVSIFVNPTQFGPGEDFASYPRDPGRDGALLAGAGCDLLLLPGVETVYPPGSSTRVRVDGPSLGFESDYRPGHFEGVATVVAALCGLVRPDVAVFGEKDAQQLAVVRALARDLHFGIEIVSGPIVRDADGLALSSRNVYLEPEERSAATVLAKALDAARLEIAGGMVDADEIAALISALVATEPLVQLEYVAVVDADSFRPLERIDLAAGGAAPAEIVIPIAARVGKTRLIDNLRLRPV
jgi:pantoate--beta-alanine ligase